MTTLPAPASTSCPAPAPTATRCRARDEVVADELPELLAAFTTREDLRRSGRPLAELAAAADRLALARLAVRASC